MLTTGQRLGTYEILGVLGAGGMGEVYRARDLKLQRDVAIKVLPAAVGRDPERLVRFEREARLLASLNHVNIAGIYGIEESSGTTALVLELVEGETLEERIAAGPLPVSQALGIARQIADGLDAAHQRGVVHRDLKPANIKLTPAGDVKVLDFGLAKALEPEPAGAAPALANSPTFTAAATRDGIIMGTAPYMSPEQARGQFVDRRTDVWAFGCVLYEMLTGRRAFGGSTVSDTVVSVLEREPDFAALPHDTPPSVRRLLRRALRKDARSRLHDIVDARLDLEDALAPGEGEASAVPLVRESPRRVLLWSVVASAVTAGLLAGAWFWYSATRVTPPSLTRVVRLVSTAAHESGPAISPDGKWVAYLSNARGPTDIWVKFLSGGDPYNLTATQKIAVQDQTAISGLEISPDGGLIAFSTGGGSAQDAAVWVIPAPLGGPARRLLPVGFHGLRWSPDGKRTAFIRAGGSAGDAIWIADGDGQNAREVMKAEGGEHAHWLRWSPDQRWIYFTRQIQNFIGGSAEIYRLSVETGRIEPVVTTPRRAGMPLPTPDGRGLLYAANPESIELGLWWRDLKTAETRRLTTGVGEYAELSASADGRKIVATVLDSRHSLARVRLTAPQPSLEPVTDGFTGDLDPAWTPDRSRLLFSSSRGGTLNIWSMGRDFSGAAPLTVGNTMDFRPSISPDGQQFAFLSDRGGRQGVWVMPLDNGTPRLVTPAVLLDGVSWSTDGHRLVAAVAGAAQPTLISIQVADGRIAPLPTPSSASAPVWSPVEDLVAYLEPRGSAMGTRLRFVTGSGKARPEMIASQEPTVFGNGLLSWAPDGKRLAVIGLPGTSTGSIWTATIGAPVSWKKVMDLPAGVYLRGATWSADGTELIVGVVRWSGDIILAER